MAESEPGFQGGWWSTRQLGDICAFDCFVSWQTVLEENPHPTIIVAGEGAGSLGLNLGRGPDPPSPLTLPLHRMPPPPLHGDRVGEAEGFR